MPPTNPARLPTKKAQKNIGIFFFSASKNLFRVPGSCDGEEESLTEESIDSSLG
jgi:hypothetical protein